VTSDHLADAPIFSVDAEIALDYFVGTVFGTTPEGVVDHLAGVLRLERETCRPLPGYPGYSSACGLFLGGDKLVTVQWGNTQKPLVVAPGFISNALDETLRKNRFDYQCSRKDVAIDVCDEVAFDSFAKAAGAKAHREGVRVNLHGDWMTPGSPAGRTMYLYARSSPFFIRIYEHNKLHVGSGVDCRVEVECKPEKSPGKQQLASLSPQQIVGLRLFAVELLAEFGISIERCRPAVARRQMTDLEVRTLHLAQQYGGTVHELMARYDSDAAAVIAAILDAEKSLIDSKRKVREAAARPQAVPLICL